MYDELTKLINRDVDPRLADLAEQARVRLIRSRAAQVMARESRGSRGGADMPDLTTVTQEAWLRLEKGTVWESRAHFLGAAANAARQILIEAARRRNTRQRHNAALRRRAQAQHGDQMPPVELDKLLRELEREDPRAARVAGHHVFGGLKDEIIAECEHISVRTVQRDLRFAQAWLAARIARDR